jgi:hypothetical protein
LPGLRPRGGWSHSVCTPVGLAALLGRRKRTRQPLSRLGVLHLVLLDGDRGLVRGHAQPHPDSQRSSPNPLGSRAPWSCRRDRRRCSSHAARRRGTYLSCACLILFDFPDATLGSTAGGHQGGERERPTQGGQLIAKHRPSPFVLIDVPDLAATLRKTQAERPPESLGLSSGGGQDVVRELSTLAPSAAHPGDRPFPLGAARPIVRCARPRHLPVIRIKRMRCKCCFEGSSF